MDAMSAEAIIAAAAGPSIIVPLTSIVERLELPRLFTKHQPMEVELGSGDGNFLIAWAQMHPETNFIGVERLLGRLRKIEKKGRRAGLVNLRAVRIEASYFMKYLLPPGSAQAAHIYFPDPWPKRRHWRRRLINAEFTAIVAQALTPGGKVFLRTDDAHYFAQMTAVFEGNPHFERTTTPTELSALLTDFERDFQAKGVATLSAAFELTNT